jgi:hypothetical protein
MTLKSHILFALQEQLDACLALINRLTPAQRQTALLPSHWTAQDHLIHLWAWQQRSTARVEAALQDATPQYPQWGDADPEGDDVDAVNAWIYQTYHDQPWETTLQAWQSGYQRLIASAQALAERDLLDYGRFPWTDGYSIADTLLSTYDHHREHYEMLLAWVETNIDE